MLLIQLHVIMIRFLYPLSKPDKSKESRCVSCGFYFTSNSYKFYCCDKAKPVCAKCEDTHCISCGKIRNKRLNLACFKCQRSYDQSEMFFDFLADKAYCSKCLSFIYINEYDQRFNHPIQTNEKAVRLYAGKQYPYEDLVNYFRLLCICCGENCKEKDGFQLAKNARVCQNCIQSRIQIMSKMLKCVECQGYIHSSSEISITLGSTQIYCVYCEKKNADQLKKYQPKHHRQSTQILGSAIFSAVDMSQLRQLNLSMESKSSMKEEEINVGPKKIKIHYRNSAVDDIENLPIEVPANGELATCFMCSVLYSQEAMLQFKIQEPFKRSNKKNELVCRICYIDMNFPQLFEKQQKQIRQKPNQNKLLESPKLNIINKKSPITPQKQPQVSSKSGSPSIIDKFDIFACIKCRTKFGSIKIQSGYFCNTCYYQKAL